MGVLGKCGIRGKIMSGMCVFKLTFGKTPQITQVRHLAISVVKVLEVSVKSLSRWDECFVDLWV